MSTMWITLAPFSFGYLQQQRPLVISSPGFLAKWRYSFFLRFFSSLRMTFLMAAIRSRSSLDSSELWPSSTSFFSSSLPSFLSSLPPFCFSSVDYSLSFPFPPFFLSFLPLSLPLPLLLPLAGGTGSSSFSSSSSSSDYEAFLLFLRRFSSFSSNSATSRSILLWWLAWLSMLESVLLLDADSNFLSISAEMFSLPRRLLKSRSLELSEKSFTKLCGSRSFF